MKTSLLITLITLLSPLAVYAQTSPENIADPAVESPQEPAATVEEVKENTGIDDAYAHVSEQATAFVDRKREQFRQKGKQVFIYSGAAMISVRPTHPGWGDARVLAYQEALQKAREELLRQLYLDVSSETIRRSFKSNQLPEFSPEEMQSSNMLGAVLDKLVALSDAVINEELEELGVDPAQYASAPPTKRKLMMQKAITQTISTRARGDISGTMTLKSYEATDDEGNTAVAVVIATSNKMKNMLADFRQSKGNITPQPNRAKQPINEYLVQNKENLMFTIGTKVLWDEKGYPVLASFGMAGNDCNPSDYESCVDNREFSFISARNSALANFAEAYNLRGKVESEQTKGKDRRKDSTATLTENRDTETVEETVTKLINETQQMSQMTSSVKGLVGIQTAFQWTVKHPITNREINGVVMLWHPETEKSTRSFKEGVKRSSPKSTGKDTRYKVGSNEGLDSDDENF
ncbi:hypothetical protein CA267_013365 [Alteromonas pelagimontana]|uniref:DUF6844 domain-containing protein n=1 Tax=Alteromonas pelagimontana TaxID=1858656 RepID=A0A6M4MGF3_9ALTE|nr:hypothetical protein [Alteromonas pelagimontana]QJR81685.1 hypothetical protein CA267_013365 [Alteromonas pelagimontana]